MLKIVTVTRKGSCVPCSLMYSLIVIAKRMQFENVFFDNSYLNHPIIV